MSDVPSNLIPVRLSQLPLAATTSSDGQLIYIYGGVNYRARVSDLLAQTGVPTTRQVLAGTGLTGGGPLATDVTLSVATGGITTPLLEDNGVTAGVYGSASAIPVITVDAKGRVSAATTAAVTPNLGDITPTSVTASGAVTGSNLSGTNTGDQNLFRTIAVSGQSDIVADSATDTLTVASGSGITLTTNAGGDTLTIAVSSGAGLGNVTGPVGSVTGNVPVFADTTGQLLSDAGFAPQPADATLTALAALTVAANSLTVGTGADAFTQTAFAANTFPARASTGSLVAKPITDFGLSLVDDADASVARTTLGVVPGTDVQAYDADLAAIAALSPSDNDVIQRKAGAWTNRSLSQYATDLFGTGLGSNDVGFRIIPQNIQSSDYFIGSDDSGKEILHPSGSGTSVFTIQSNSALAFPIGTCLTFTNRDTSDLIILCDDTMYLAGTVSTGARTLAQNGIATAKKVEATVWIISGVGLT